MSKPLGQDNSMLHFKERQSTGIAIGTESKIKSKPYSSYSSWSRKLLVGGLILITLAGSAYAAGKSKQEVKSKSAVTQTQQLATDGGKKIDSNYSKVISSATTLVYNGDSYNIRFETKDSVDFITGYADGKQYSLINVRDEIQKNFSGKFTNREIIFGNPSMMIKGVDGKGNYCYLLVDDIGAAKVLVTPITSGFKKDILDKLKVSVECKFDEKAKIWRISWQRNGKELEYDLFSENGIKLDGKNLGMEELYDSTISRK